MKISNIISLIAFFVFIGCSSPRGYYKIHLNKDYKEFTMEGSDDWTMSNNLSITGKCDCDITIRIEYYRTLFFKKGKKIEHSEFIRDWYQTVPKVEIWSKGCSKDSYLIFENSF